MGNSDNWHTPKQLKIEREGEPRPPRRGPRKKAQRKKGVKARLDEVLSARLSLKRAKDYLARAEVHQGESWWLRNCRENLAREQAHYDAVVAKCVKDGIDPY